MGLRVKHPSEERALRGRGGRGQCTGLFLRVKGPELPRGTRLENRHFCFNHTRADADILLITST